MQQTQYLPYAFFQGKIVKKEAAVVPIMTNSLQYGTTVFGGIRAYLSSDKKHLILFRLDDHFSRFLNSLKILGVSIPHTKADLIKKTTELLYKNKSRQDTYIRPFAFIN